MGVVYVHNIILLILLCFVDGPARSGWVLYGHTGRMQATLEELHRVPCLLPPPPHLRLRPQVPSVAFQEFPQEVPREVIRGAYGDADGGGNQGSRSGEVKEHESCEVRE